MDGEVKEYSFRPPKNYKPQKQAFWCTRNLQGIMWKSDCLDNSELPNILPKDTKPEYFAKGTEKSKILGNLMDKEVENLDDHGCPKIRDLVDPRADGETWICPSYPFRHKTTLHCAERKANMLGQWTMLHLRL